MNKLGVDKASSYSILYMYRLFYLLIIPTLGVSFNYISHPKLTQYPSIISKLDSVSKNTGRKVRNINYGGCGYFAYYLCNLLDSTGLEYEISIINVEGKNHITHILIYVPDYNLFIDSKGVYKGINVNGDKYFYCLKIERTLTKAQLRTAISTLKWNSKFHITDTTMLKANLRF